MADFTILKEACYQRVVDVVSQFTSNPHSHVIRADDSEPEQPPMVALAADTRPDPVGMHDTRVIEVETNPYDILYGEDRVFALDMSIVDVDGDRADNIYDGLNNSFTFDGRVRDPQALVGADGPPISDVTTRDMSPLGRDERVGHVLATEVEYTRRFRHSDLTDPPVSADTVVQQFNGDEFDPEFEFVTSADGHDVREL
jgi:hypothetical protein